MLFNKKYARLRPQELLNQIAEANFLHRYRSPVCVVDH
jgi:hypothetical protein